MPEDDDIDLKRHQKGHIDQSQWITVSDEEMNVISDSKLMKKLSRVCCLIVNWYFVVKFKIETCVFSLSEKNSSIWWNCYFYCKNAPYFWIFWSILLYCLFIRFLWKLIIVWMIHSIINILDCSLLLEYLSILYESLSFLK